MTTINKELESFKCMTSKWDGEREAPTEESVGDAEFLIDRIKLDGNIRMPKTLVFNDGLVALFWDKLDSYLEIGFYGNGTVYYWWTFNNKFEKSKDKIKIDTLLEAIPRYLWSKP